MSANNKNLSDPFVKKVESFALDFVRLIRSVRVFPPNHPSLTGTVSAVLSNIPFDLSNTFTVGVAPMEIIVNGEFIGRKAGALARLLHARKVLRMFWTREVRPEDVWALARILSTPKIEGEEICRRLRTEGVFSIDLEPLQLGNIHGEIADSVIETQADREKRRRMVWLSLMNKSASIEEIASTLASEEFWMDVKEAWSNSGYGDSEGFAKLLIDLGERFDSALTLLSDHQKKRALDYLAQLGNILSVQDLVRIVFHEAQNRAKFGQGVSALLRDIDGERFVDLLAGIAASGEQDTKRLVEVFRSFKPMAASEDILSLVRERLSLGQDSGFAAEVWKTVEDFILKLMEASFMDEDYSGSLNQITDSGPSLNIGKEWPQCQTAAENNLDDVFLCLAKEDERGREKLLNRLKGRVAQGGVIQTLQFIKAIDDVLPGMLDSYPYLVKTLFHEGIHAVSKAGEQERRDFIHFALRHETILLDMALKALAEEGRISIRHFLVHLLSFFSPAAIPVFISKARNGPWYVARNLVIVLSHHQSPYTLPTLRALSRHSHPKVRREALKALRVLEGAGGSLAPTAMTGEMSSGRKEPLIRPASLAQHL
jgi:hypothetical protein